MRIPNPFSSFAASICLHCVFAAYQQSGHCSILNSRAPCQDVYRRVAAPQALSGLLRIRTSPEFKAAKAHGHLFPDEQYEELAHIAECEASTTFAFDFEYTRAAGFSEASDNPPMLQAAFQYSTVVPSSEQRSSSAEGTASQAQPRCIFLSCLS